MRRQLVQIEGMKRNQNPTGAVQFALQRLQEWLISRLQMLQNRPGRVWGGTKLRRRSFGSERISAVTSSSLQCGNRQPNSSPPRRARAPYRDMDGDAVIGRTGFEAVGQRQRQIVGLPAGPTVGIRIGDPKKVIAGHRETVPVCDAACTTIRRNAWRTTHPRDPRVEGEDLIVADQQIGGGPGLPSSATSARSRALPAKKWCRVCQSPSTSAWRMNISGPPPDRPPRTRPGGARPGRPKSVTQLEGLNSTYVGDPSAARCRCGRPDARPPVRRSPVRCAPPCARRADWFRRGR